MNCDFFADYLALGTFAFTWSIILIALGAQLHLLSRASVLTWVNYCDKLVLPSIHRGQGNEISGKKWTGVS